MNIIYAFWQPIHSNTAVQIILLAVGLLMVCDIIAGITTAIVNKKFESERLRVGIGHKASEIMFLVVADIVDTMLYGGVSLPIDLPSGSALMVVGTALVITEISSLMEIAVKLNPELQDNPLFQILKSVKTKAEDKKSDE